MSDEEPQKPHDQDAKAVRRKKPVADPRPEEDDDLEAEMLPSGEFVFDDSAHDDQPPYVAAENAFNRLHDRIQRLGSMFDDTTAIKKLGCEDFDELNSRLFEIHSHIMVLSELLNDGDEEYEVTPKDREFVIKQFQKLNRSRTMLQKFADKLEEEYGSAGNPDRSDGKKSRNGDDGYKEEEKDGDIAYADDDEPPFLRRKRRKVEFSDMHVAEVLNTVELLNAYTIHAATSIGVRVISRYMQEGDEYKTHASDGEHPQNFIVQSELVNTDVPEDLVDNIKLTISVPAEDVDFGSPPQ